MPGGEDGKSPIPVPNTMKVLDRNNQIKEVSLSVMAMKMYDGLAGAFIKEVESLGLLDLSDPIEIRPHGGEMHPPNSIQAELFNFFSRRNKIRFETLVRNKKTQLETTAAELGIEYPPEDGGGTVGRSEVGGSRGGLK